MMSLAVVAVNRAGIGFIPLSERLKNTFQLLNTSMFEGKNIAVVIPAYNESHLIAKVINTLPDFVDHIVVVDDLSLDDTVSVVQNVAGSNDKIALIQHEENQGVGAAIASGYKWAVANHVDVTVVMGADFQMDPEDLPGVVGPVCHDETDYAKGNRLFRGESWSMIPKHRYLGNSFLSLMTKIASGYWHIADSQSGYTAISLSALQSLNLDNLYPRYGIPNDILIKLNIGHFRVRDVSIKPVYNVGEKSGIKVRKVIFTIPWLLLKGFGKRMLEKYVIRDFHPLVFFYLLAVLLVPSGFIMGIYLFLLRISGHPVAVTSALFASFLFISGLQSLFFAMWFDMDYNKELR